MTSRRVLPGLLLLVLAVGAACGGKQVPAACATCPADAAPDQASAADLGAPEDASPTSDTSVTLRCMTTADCDDGTLTLSPPVLQALPVPQR